MRILSERKGFASDHSSTSYEFLAVDKPLTKKDRAEVSSQSSRVNPTSRRANFIYNIDGYDIPCGWEELMARYYDVMYREEYGWWTLAMAFDASPELYEVLVEYAFEGEGNGANIEITYPDGRRIIIAINCVVKYFDDNGGYDSDEDDDAVFSTDDELLNALVQIRRQIMKGNYRALNAVFDKYYDSDGGAPLNPNSADKDERIICNFLNMLG